MYTIQLDEQDMMSLCYDYTEVEEVITKIFDQAREQGFEGCSDQ